MKRYSCRSWELLTIERVNIHPSDDPTILGGGVCTHVQLLYNYIC